MRTSVPDINADRSRYRDRIGSCSGSQPNSSRDDRILPGRLGLPATNTRSSEPFVTRIYKTDDNDQILKKQPRGYPFTITEDYELAENEKAQVHKGVDITSRSAPTSPPDRWTSRLAFTVSS